MLFFYHEIPDTFLPLDQNDFGTIDTGDFKNFSFSTSLFDVQNSTSSY